ncbi:unnamed protein product [Schistosoma curassoni]|uniref:Secreted protein n=1 Tax=Schistosoma curassoni TaxID=6186 RepID=A0A183KRQ8_9TREM|nr:unnamed protein product [Schistosoma curassoni]
MDIPISICEHNNSCTFRIQALILSLASLYACKRTTSIRQFNSSIFACCVAVFWLFNSTCNSASFFANEALLARREVAEVKD